MVYGASAEDRATLVEYLSKLHPGRNNANMPMGFGSDSLKNAAPVAIVGAIGSGDNDIPMLKKAKIAFSTSQKCTQGAMAAADMVLENDSIQDVVYAVTKGRSYKDHLLKFCLMQIPACLAAIAMVLTQVFLYDTILVTGCFIFMVNLVYFPMGIACIVRENAQSRWSDMIGRWRSSRFPGTKGVSGYMKGEYFKTSLLINTLYQLGALGGLYYYAGYLFTLVHVNLDWEKDDPLFINEEWLTTHAF